MGLFRSLVALVSVGLFSACSSGEQVSREVAVIPDEPPALRETSLSQSWGVADINVEVPVYLSVSEANTYYPRADIVWRGDPYGDRYAQVRAIMQTGFQNGLSHLQGPRPVTFDVKLKRFHSLTEKTRYTVGGVHNIIYMLTVKDARTGSVLLGPEKVEMDINALGGRRAYAADRRGLTQKVRIVSHMIKHLQEEFPGANQHAGSSAGSAAAIGTVARATPAATGPSRLTR